MKLFLVTIIDDEENVIETYTIESEKQPTKKRIINKIRPYSYAIANGILSLENLIIKEQTTIKM